MLLPRALVLLRLLETRGMARRLLRQMKRPAGALFVAIYALILAPAVLNALFLRQSEFHAPPEWIVRMAPPFIGILCVLTLIAPAARNVFTFKPAEIDVLFTGPYSRRHVVTYKLLGTVFGALFMAIIIALAMGAAAPARIPMFIGVYLAFQFSVFFNAAYSMLMLSLSTRAKYCDYAVAAAVLAAIAYAVFAALQDLSNAVGIQRDPGLIIEGVLNRPYILAVSLPFVPFAHVMAADGGAIAWGGWTLVCVGMIGALYAAILALDADYMESAIARSAKLYARVERLKRGQFFSERAITRARRWSIPQLPRFGGFGPVAWRQLTGAAHAWGYGLIALYALAIAAGVYVRRYDVDESIQDLALPVLLGLLLYLSIVIVNLIRFDFRSDIDVMDGLKTLPVRATTLAAAQLVAPTMLIAAMYCAIGLGTAIGVNRLDIAPAIAMLSVPFAALLIGTENLVFLLWPTRAPYQGNMDLQHMGRGVFALMVKFVILVPALGLAAGAGAACAFLTQSWALGYAVAALVMTIEAALTVPAIASAFDKFDPSTDTPP
ncbi:MAG: hypothetical protein FJY92_01265 [Candidatus Hydrogenedentes bacterium]|nr:hypothetical protein [Candidatus Hydrogenedentota bacterium]